jgi:flagellar protein FliT
MAADADELVGRYEAFVALTRQLLAAARASEWDRLVSLGHDRDHVLSIIKHLDATVRLDSMAIGRKAKLIEEHIALDAETCKLVESWMADLKSAMHSNLQEQRLLKQYGAD